MSKPSDAFPLLRAPLTFLMALAVINWAGYASWVSMLNNFAKEAVDFSGREMGMLQSIREIPGLLAVSALLWLALMREQTLAYVSLVILGAGIAATGFFPTITGLWLTTLLMSVGFHYYETMNQSLTLQLVPKADAPKVLGRISSTSSIAQLLSYGLIALVFWLWKPDYTLVFALTGVLCMLGAIAAWLLFPRFEGPVPQRKGLIIRKKYGLYYALTMMSGARRQIFMAFGAFLLVERFGYDVSRIAILLLVTNGLNTLIAPRLGALIGSLGERATIIFENITLIVVFAGYAAAANGLIPAAATVAAFLFITDGVFFTLTIAQRTYFQKIADPADIAPTSGVAFTINHIAAVFIPALFGLIWLKNPSLVFIIGAGIASVSLALSFLVPRHPAQGHETTLWQSGET